MNATKVKYKIDHNSKLKNSGIQNFDSEQCAYFMRCCSKTVQKIDQKYLKIVNIIDNN